MCMQKVMILGILSHTLEKKAPEEDMRKNAQDSNTIIFLVFPSQSLENSVISMNSFTRSPLEDATYSQIAQSLY